MDHPETGGGPKPAVSIILPTYNRARFLPQALESIRSQRFTDWELIVIDDGSTDDTPAVLPVLTAGLPQPVRCVRQPNRGAYGARNTGLDLARGEYVAFFDSDDVWLPDYLWECATAARANPDVDWVYAACRIVDHATGRVLEPSTFRVDGQPRPFLRLRTRTAGELNILDDPGTLHCLIASGLFCGLQNSLIRRRVFAGRRFPTRHRNEGEDVLAAIRAVVAGHRLAYLDRSLVVYHVHEQNSSAAARQCSVAKHLRLMAAYMRGYEDLWRELRHHPTAGPLLRQVVAANYFWHLGYNLYWHHGRRREAVAACLRGLWIWPGCVPVVPTGRRALARLRAALGGGPARPAAMA
jgi:glycosyltransferase involved in cell wall biosynthesis